MDKQQGVSDTDIFFPSILESVAEGIVVISMDKKLIFINKTTMSFIGLHDEPVEGLRCSDIIRTDLQGSVKRR